MSVSKTPSDTDMNIFLDACENGALADIRWFLKYYPHQWGCNRGGTTGLMYASFHGRGAAVQELLDKEYAAWADVNAQDDKGMSALHYAAKEGKEFVVKLLLDNKASASVFTKDEKASPLLVAARGGHKEVLEILLAKFPDLIDKPTASGATPLWCAVLNGEKKVVRFLLDQGAKLAIVIDGKTMIDKAKVNGHVEIAEMLAEEPKRRDAAISADVEGGISSGLKLRGTLTLVAKKVTPKIPQPETERKRHAALTPAHKPIFP